MAILTRSYQQSQVYEEVAGCILNTKSSAIPHATLNVQYVRGYRLVD